MPNAPSGAPQFANWSFHEDFSRGIPGWMSFPLAQDVGYDPSIYTAQRRGRTVLVRDVVAEKGEHRLQIGMIRPLSFHATAMSVFRLEYGFEPVGRLARALFRVCSVSGRSYTARLPLKRGRQHVRITGRQLGITSAGEDMETAVVEAVIQQPVWGAHHQLTIYAFRIEAQRIPTVALRSPRMTRSEGMQVSVADQVSVPGNPLRVQTQASNRPATLILLDGAGKEKFRSNFTGSINPDLGRESPGLWTGIVLSGGARTEFRFLVLGTEAPHPRVLLRTARLAQLRNDSSLRDLLHRQFEETAAGITSNPWAGENINTLSSASVLVGLPQYFALMESRSHAASLGALDYVLNRNAQGLAIAKKILAETSAWPSWTPPWFAAHGLHTYYETGIFSQRLALAYDLIADQLSAQEKEQIAQGFLHNSIDPAIREYFLNDRMPIAASNHMAHAVGGAIADCVALAGDVPDWEERFAPRLAQLVASFDCLLNGLFPGDGSEAEPAGYENFAMEGMSWAASALDSIGIHSPGLEKMLQSFWWERYIRIRADLMLDTGDFDGELSALTGFAWSAEYSGDSSIRAFYESGNNRALTVLSRLQDTGRALESAPGLLDLVCCTGPSPDPPSPPPSRVFPLRGSAVLRSGWREDDTVISLRVGPWFNHEHHDQGTFQVAAFGEKLIGEAGYSDYYKDPQYLDYFTQAPGHNTIIVDHNPFSQGDYDGRYWKALQLHPSITCHLFSERFDYLIADLAPAYKGTLKHFTREYLFFKPGLLIIHDQISSTDAHSYRWFLHPSPGTRTSVNHEQARITGSQGTALISTSDGSWSMIPQPMPVIAYSDFERGHMFSRSAFELDSPRQTRHTFLIGMQFAKLSGTESPLVWKKADNGASFEVNAANSEIQGTFRTSSGELSLGETITDGDALLLASGDAGRDVFASHARKLTENKAQLVSSVSPVELLLHESGATREYHFASSASTTVTFPVSDAPSELVLDGKPASANYSKGVIVINLTAGEHVVTLKR